MEAKTLSCLQGSLSWQLGYKWKILQTSEGQVFSSIFFSVYGIGRTVSAKQCCGFCDGKEVAEMQLWLCVVFVCCILRAKIH